MHKPTTNYWHYMSDGVFETLVVEAIELGLSNVMGDRWIQTR